VGCSAVQFGNRPSFRRNIPPTSSEWQSKTSRKEEETGSDQTLGQLQSFDYKMFVFPVGFPKTYVSCYIRFQVITLVTRKITVFWNLTLCSLLELCKSFDGSLCLHIQGRRLLYHEDGSSSGLRNVGNFPPCYMASYLRNSDLH
jgi:hypothetical protein